MSPDPKELEEYAAVLQAELDGFFEDKPQFRHRVEVLYDKTSRTGVVNVELLKNQRGTMPVKVRPADGPASADFQRAREQARQKRGQWLYFQRNLRIYRGSRSPGAQAPGASPLAPQPGPVGRRRNHRRKDKRRGEMTCPCKPDPSLLKRFPTAATMPASFVATATN